MSDFRNYQFYNFQGGLDFKNSAPLVEQGEKNGKVVGELVRTKNQLQSVDKMRRAGQTESDYGVR